MAIHHGERRTLWSSRCGSSLPKRGPVAKHPCCRFEAARPDALSWPLEPHCWVELVTIRDADPWQYRMASTSFGIRHSLLVSQEINSDTNQHGRSPPPVVHILFKKYLRGNGIRYQR